MVAVDHILLSLSSFLSTCSSCHLLLLYLLERVLCVYARLIKSSYRDRGVTSWFSVLPSIASFLCCVSTERPKKKKKNYRKHLHKSICWRAPLHDTNNNNTQNKCKYFSTKSRQVFILITTISAISFNSSVRLIKSSLSSLLSLQPCNFQFKSKLILVSLLFFLSLFLLLASDRIHCHRVITNRNENSEQMNWIDSLWLTSALVFTIFIFPTIIWKS